jgi:hypothetical protein
MIKIINDLNKTSLITSIDNINIDDYKDQFTNLQFINFLYDDNNKDDKNKIELHKLLILLNIMIV